jgi:hypothetical protein
MADARMHSPSMKIPRPSHWHRSFPRWVCATACLFPAILSAHPGHYHPDETDEFDFLRTTFFHSHGALDYLLAAVIISSIAVAWCNGKPAVRISAAAMALGSLAMLPIF